MKGRSVARARTGNPDTTRARNDTARFVEDLPDLNDLHTAAVPVPGPSALTSEGQPVPTRPGRSGPYDLPIVWKSEGPGDRLHLVRDCPGESNFRAYPVEEYEDHPEPVSGLDPHDQDRVCRAVGCSRGLVVADLAASEGPIPGTPSQMLLIQRGLSAWEDPVFATAAARGQLFESGGRGPVQAVIVNRDDIPVVWAAHWFGGMPLAVAVRPAEDDDPHEFTGTEAIRAAETFRKHPDGSRLSEQVGRDLTVSVSRVSKWENIPGRAFLQDLASNGAVFEWEYDSYEERLDEGRSSTRIVGIPTCSSVRTEKLTWDWDWDRSSSRWKEPGTKRWSVSRYAVDRVLTAHKVWDPGRWQGTVSNDYYDDNPGVGIFSGQHETDRVLYRMSGRSPDDQLREALRVEYGTVPGWAQRERFQVIEVPFTDLRVNRPERVDIARRELDTQAFTSIHKGLVAGRPCALAVPHPQGGWVVADGYHRVAVAREHRVERVSIVTPV